MLSIETLLIVSGESIGISEIQGIGGLLVLT